MRRRRRRKPQGMQILDSTTTEMSNGSRSRYGRMHALRHDFFFPERRCGCGWNELGVVEVTRSWVYRHFVFRLELFYTDTK